MNYVGNKIKILQSYFLIYFSWGIWGQTLNHEPLKKYPNSFEKKSLESIHMNQFSFEDSPSSFTYKQW